VENGRENDRELDERVIEKLLALSGEAAHRAYAPFSKYQVGAALVTTENKFFSGVNVENRSYPLSMCAERVAVFGAVAELGPSFELLAVAVTAAQGGPCAPCGGCRQVLAEFGAPDLLLVYRGREGMKRVALRTMLPDGTDFLL
jgi:cytidine deaminase